MFIYMLWIIYSFIGGYINDLIFDLYKISASYVHLFHMYEHIDGEIYTHIITMFISHLF